MNKAIYYYTLAANQNMPPAQYNLGILYYNDPNNKMINIKKGIYFILLSSKNGFRQGNFAHGFLIHEGKFLKRDINDAIHYYKEASSFNNQYAKNNLGIIYKIGFGKEIKAILANSIENFKEAIYQKNDKLSMYNLAHAYIYNDQNEINIKECFDLLIKSSYELHHSLVLLCLLLVKKFGFNLQKIKEEIDTIEDLKEYYSSKICSEILFLELN